MTLFKQCFLLCLLSCLAPGSAAQQFTTSTGDLVLWKDGTTLPISNHSDQTGIKALVRAIEMGPGTYRVKRPDIVIVVKPGAAVAYPACGTGRCDSTPEAIAARRERSRLRTAEWTNALHANLAKMRWPSEAVLDANLALWQGAVP